MVVQGEMCLKLNLSLGVYDGVACLIGLGVKSFMPVDGFKLKLKCMFIESIFNRLWVDGSDMFRPPEFYTLVDQGLLEIL